jgi:hypothetical protein
MEGSGRDVILRQYPRTHQEGLRKTKKKKLRIAGIRAEI